MNIVHINTQDLNGGAAKVAHRLMLSQLNEGHNSAMLVGKKESNSLNSKSFASEPDLNEQLLKSGLLYYHLQGSHSLIDNYLVKNADIIHLHNLHGDYFNPFSLLLLSAIKPVIWTLHDMQSMTGHCAHSFECGKWKSECGSCPDLKIDPQILTDSTSRLLDDKRYIYRNSEFTLTAPSSWLKNKIQFSILKEHNCELVYNGIDTTVFKPYDKSQVRKKYNIPENVFIIGGVANAGTLYNPWKGPVYTEQSLKIIFEKIPNSVFLNIGSKVNSNRNRIIDIPPVTDENQLAELYSLMDIYLTTSVADNAPLVVLEALSCGVPVVSFETGGIPEMVIHNKTGNITEYKNSVKTAEAVIKLASDKNKLKGFGSEARKDILKRYDHKIINEQYLNLYNEITAVKSKDNKKFFSLNDIPSEIKTGKFISAYNSVLEKKVSSPSVLIKSDLSKITIITPSFNQGDYIEQCIDSILSQDYSNLEYIIMDGGSTDKSVDIIKRYSKHLHCWQSKKDGGQYNAINEGFRMSSGEIMGWLNSDDMLHKDGLKIMTEIFRERKDVKFLTGKRVGFDISGNLRSYGFEEQTWSRKNLLNKKVIHELSLFIMQEATYWKRELWDKAGGSLNLGYKLAADFELWARFTRFERLHTTDQLIGGFRYYSNEQRCNNFRDEYIKECDAIIDNELSLPWIEEYNEAPELIKYNSLKQKPSPLNIQIKKELPKISVITPSFNQGKYLEECIDSVLNQKYPNLEYIIMDGGSNDGSAEIIKKYSKHLTYWQSVKDNGQYAAINEGFRKSSGEIMTWLNSDDKFHSNSFSNAADIFLSRPEIQWLMGRPNGINQNGSQAWIFNYLPLWNRQKYLSKKYHNPFIQQEGTFWTRGLWNKAGALINSELKLAGDLELWARFFRYEELYTADCLLAGFRNHSDQKTAQHMESYHKEASAILDKEIEYFNNNKTGLLSPPPPVIFIVKHQPENSVLVSAIVSVYNSEKYIQGCVEDLINQTLYKKGQLEIVFVNTGSKQNEEAVIKRYEEALPNIKYVKVEQRETVYQAWNRGIKTATGKYITNANTDDRHKYDALEIMASELENNPGIALVYADQYVTNTENQTFEQHTLTGCFYWPEFDRLQLIHTSSCGPQPLWRKSLHDEFGYFDETLKVAGDYEWWLRISEKYNFKHIPQFLGLYLISEQSIEHHYEQECIKETHRVRNYYASRIKLTELDYNKYKPTFLVPIENVQAPLVSVIIPTFNRRDNLKAAVKSVLKQSFKNFEIIVVNDAGKDVSEMLRNFNDKRIKYLIHEQNKGPAAARNTGIRFSSAKLIALLDDDDVFYPDHLAYAIQSISKENRIVYTDAVRNTYLKNGTKYQLVNKDIPYSIAYHKDKLLFGNIAPVNCFVFDKLLAEQVNYFDESLSVLEDWDFWLKISRVTSFKHIKKATVQVNWKTDGTTMTSSKQEDFMKCQKLVTSRYAGENITSNPESIINEFKSIWSNDGKILHPLASIIVLTYNGLEYNKQFIDSVISNTKYYELIIVDNASTDGTVEYLKGLVQQNSKIKLILNSTNNGFPKAVNQGLKASLAPYIVIANNDIIVTEGWLERMIETAESDYMIGIVGPISNSVSGVQLDKNAVYKSIQQMHIYAKKIRNSNKGKTFEFPRVAFLCTLIKREVIDIIGGLDERFSPGNFEDDDYCLRAQLTGFKTVIAKDVFIHHFGSKSFTADGMDKYRERLAINEKIFVDKWGANPEDIWLKGKQINKRKIIIPLNENSAVECFQRAMILVEEQDFSSALPYLKKAEEEFNFEIEQLVSMDQLKALIDNITILVDVNKKKNPPKFSILILTYNRAQMLNDCLTALKKNLFYKDDYELIIADNGSTDNTQDIIKKFSPHKVLNSSTNKGWNFYKDLFASASGEYIIEMDDDVLDFPEHFDKAFIEYFNEFSDFGILSLDVIQNEHTNGAKPSDEHYEKIIKNDKVIMEGPSGGWCLCIKKSVLDNTNFATYDLNNLHFEDGFLYNKAKEAGYRAGIIKDLKCFHASGLKYSIDYGYLERDIEKYRISGFYEGFVSYSDKKFETNNNLKELLQYAMDLYKIKFYQKSLERFAQILEVVSKVNTGKDNPGIISTLLCFIGLNYYALSEKEIAVGHIKNAINFSMESALAVSKNLVSEGFQEAILVKEIAEEIGCIV